MVFFLHCNVDQVILALTDIKICIVSYQINSKQLMYKFKHCRLIQFYLFIIQSKKKHLHYKESNPAEENKFPVCRSGV